jgi:hypothetical protein
MTTLVLLTLGAMAAQQPSGIAPSIPRLSKEEQAQVRKVIDRFIQAELDRLPPAEKAQAVADFYALGPESVFELVAGLNRAAQLESSCAAVLIARKLQRILAATQDVDLLDFVRENAGAGVTGPRAVVNAVRDLRLYCALRKNQIQRLHLALGFPPGQKSLTQMSVEELAQAAQSERGARLRALLTELATRQGEEVLSTLGRAAARPEPDIRQLAQRLLLQYLKKQDPETVRQALRAAEPAVRRAAAQAAGSRQLLLVDDLIALLDDPDPLVHQAAREALVRLSGGQDFGPELSADTAGRLEAQQRWRQWWDTHRRR